MTELEANEIIKAIEGLGTRFDGLESRFDGLESRFDGLESRFDGLESRFDGLESRFEKLEGKVDAVHRDLLSLRYELRGVIDPDFPPVRAASR